MKRKLLQIFILLVLAFSFFSCNEAKTSSKLKLDQSVFYEIFPAIIDSIYFDIRLGPLPSERFFSDKEQYQKVLKKWKRKTDSIKSDKSPIYLVVSDSVIQFENADSSIMRKHFNIKDSVNTFLGNDFKIDLTKLKSNNEKIRFKFRTEFPKGSEFWRTNYDYFIAATISFGKITFDETRSFGVLQGSYILGKLSGSGFRIFIRKNQNKKWIIDEIVGTWIS